MKTLWATSSVYRSTGSEEISLPSMVQAYVAPWTYLYLGETVSVSPVITVYTADELSRLISGGIGLVSSMISFQLQETASRIISAIIIELVSLIFATAFKDSN